MKKAFFLLYFLLPFFPLFLQAQNEFVASTFKNEKGDSLLYRMIEPRTITDAKKYPLVIFLHGAGERGNDNTKQLMHGSSLFLKEEIKANFPAFVIFPQCPDDEYWSSVSIDRSQLPLKLNFDYTQPITKPLASVHELVQELVASGKIDTKRIYIVGLSMGGMGTFEAVHRFPNLFAAAITICGGGDTLLFSKKASKIPFWVFHGADDNVVDVNYSRQMVSVLKKRKASVTYTEYPGVGHGSWENAFQEPELLPWLFSKKR
jgi:predicted peptidase